MDLPHFGHFKAENLNPGLAGTSVLQAGQMPLELAPELWWPVASLDLLNEFPKALADLMGFLPFLCGITRSLLIYRRILLSHHFNITITNNQHQISKVSHLPAIFKPLPPFFDSSGGQKVYAFVLRSADLELQVYLLCAFLLSFSWALETFYPRKPCGPGLSCGQSRLCARSLNAFLL